MVKSKVSVYFDGIAINRVVIVVWETVGKGETISFLKFFIITMLMVTISFLKKVSLKIFPVRRKLKNEGMENITAV